MEYDNLNVLDYMDGITFAKYLKEEAAHGAESRVNHLKRHWQCTQTRATILWEKIAIDIGKVMEDVVQCYYL